MTLLSIFSKIPPQSRRLIGRALTIAALVTFTITDAFAQTNSGGLGQVISNITSNFSNVPALLDVFALCAGGGFTIYGLIAFYQHHKNPQQHQMLPAVVSVCVGGILLGWVTFAGYVTTTFNGSGSSNSVTYQQLPSPTNSSSP